MFACLILLSCLLGLAVFLICSLAASLACLPLWPCNFLRKHGMAASPGLRIPAKSLARAYEGEAPVTELVDLVASGRPRCQLDGTAQTAPLVRLGASLSFVSLRRVKRRLMQT